MQNFVALTDTFSPAVAVEGIELMKFEKKQLLVVNYLIMFTLVTH